MWRRFLAPSVGNHRPAHEGTLLQLHGGADMHASHLGPDEPQSGDGGVREVRFVY